MSTNTISQKNTLQILITSRAYTGAVSGLVGGFAIFFVIFIIDFHLGQIPGTFYKMIGFPIGLEGISATLFGMTSHIATAALIGAVFCICSGLHQKLELNNTTKGMFAGGTTGIVVYFLFFIPITMLVIQPLIEQGMHNDLGLIATISNIESVHLMQNMTLIVSGALIIHVLFGVIMGFTATLSMEYSAKTADFHKEKTLKIITLAIIAGTIVIGVFYVMAANQTSTLSSSEVQQDKLSEELSKIEMGLTYAKFIDMNEDRRLAILAQMSPHSKGLILNEVKKFDKVVDEDMSGITRNLESASDLKFLQSAQISGVKGNDAHGKAMTVSNGYMTYLRLEDFSVTNGIDQHIYLTKNGDITRGIDVGKLKGNKGTQNYSIQGIDPNEYNQIIIYSKPFDMYYASASLTKIGSN